jgi:hypothetical protein
MFCCESCRRRYNNSACNPWHRWVFGTVTVDQSNGLRAITWGRAYQVKQLPPNSWG